MVLSIPSSSEMQEGVLWKLGEKYCQVVEFIIVSGSWLDVVDEFILQSQATFQLPAVVLDLDPKTVESLSYSTTFT